tara:strand:- start:152 stop:397 length:246 start_codon:yes stop_codon:yes gene_type:complete
MINNRQFIWIAVSLTNLHKKMSWAIATLISGYRFFFGKNKDKVVEARSPDYINIYWYILIVGSWVIVVTHVLWKAQINIYW